MRRFAVFDIDGTLIRWQLYHAITDALAKSGHLKPAAHEAIREARMRWKKRAEGSTFKDYEKQLIITYEGVLKTLSVKEMQQAVDSVFEEYKDQVYRYTRSLLKDLKQKDYVLLAISGSQTEIISKIAGYYGFDDYVGTEYASEADRFTGAKIIGSLNKDETLKMLVKKHKLSFEDSIAVGDSTSDIKMLELVKQPIAFNPERELFDHATAKGWKIVIERKNMIYELENQDGKYQLA